MTFSGELAVLLVFCSIGLVAAALSLRYAVLNYHAVINGGGDHRLIEGTGHIRSQQIALLLFWLGFELVGVLATIPVPPAAPVGTTPVGFLIRWLLLGALGIAAWMTATNFLYGRRQWLKYRPAQ